MAASSKDEGASIFLRVASCFDLPSGFSVRRHRMSDKTVLRRDSVLAIPLEHPDVGDKVAGSFVPQRDQQVLKGRRYRPSVYGSGVAEQT